MLTLGTVVLIAPLQPDAAWRSDDGVVVEVVERQKWPTTRGMPNCSLDCQRRYVVRCATRVALRTKGQMEVIAW